MRSTDIYGWLFAFFMYINSGSARVFDFDATGDDAIGATASGWKIDDDSTSMGPGAIVAIVVGVIFVVAITAIVLVKSNSTVGYRQLSSP